MKLKAPHYKPGQVLENGEVYVGFIRDYHLTCLPKDEPEKMAWRENKVWPTKEELSLMYANKDLIGGFTNDWYWSSTESILNFAWSQRFSDGNQNNSYGHKAFAYFVRKVNRYK